MVSDQQYKRTLSGQHWFVWQLPFAFCPADETSAYKCVVWFAEIHHCFWKTQSNRRTSLRMFVRLMWTLHVYTPMVLDHETMKTIVTFRG